MTPLHGVHFSSESIAFRFRVFSLVISPRIFNKVVGVVKPVTWLFCGGLLLFFLPVLFGVKASGIAFCLEKATGQLPNVTD